MTVIYDNWDRLVRATLRREELREIALRTPSDWSSSSPAATTPSPPYKFSSENGQHSSFPYIFGVADYLIDTNQIQPNLVYINGRPLSQPQMVQLQSCRNPPKKIKPGRYWYDKISGHPPSQIISSWMDIGGRLDQKASNGKTNMLLNGREITKKELWMLRIAGINYEGQPDIWLNEDGSYQCEANSLVRMLWNKPRTKFVCAALSLPFPPECRDEVSMEAADGGSNHLDEKIVHKLLLVGCNQSGTSTILKQAKILYNVPFSEDELQNFKQLIQTNLYCYIAILLLARERFEENFSKLSRKHLSQPCSSAYAERIDDRNVYSMTPRLKAFSDWLLKVIMSGDFQTIFPAATLEYAPMVEDLMKDNGFQVVYNWRHELDMLSGAANYFLDRALSISRVDYKPTCMDISLAEGSISSSSGVLSMEFSFPGHSLEGYMDPVDQMEASTSCSYQLTRVHANHLGDDCERLEVFDDSEVVIFCVSLTDYDEYYVNSEGLRLNKMMASKKLMDKIVSHPSFADRNFLLLLNKFDLLEEKLKRVPLSECEWFQDFKPVMTSYHQHRSTDKHMRPLAQSACHYIAVKFKRMFASLTDRKLYVMPIAGLESNSVDEALRYCKEILEWEEEGPRGCWDEFSSESDDSMM